MAFSLSAQPPQMSTILVAHQNVTLRIRNAGCGIAEQGMAFANWASLIVFGSADALERSE
jgi:hypothetical protein